MKKGIWISYDLGAGDYDGFYAWLDKHEAKDCSGSLAFLKYEFNEAGFLDQLREDIKSNMELGRHTRIYVVWNESGKIQGSFVFGKRKAPVWTGYGPFCIDEVDEGS